MEKSKRQGSRNKLQTILRKLLSFTNTDLDLLIQLTLKPLDEYDQTQSFGNLYGWKYKDGWDSQSRQPQDVLFSTQSSLVFFQCGQRVPINWCYWRIAQLGLSVHALVAVTIATAKPCRQMCGNMCGTRYSVRCTVLYTLEYVPNSSGIFNWNINSFMLITFLTFCVLRCLW